MNKRTICTIFMILVLIIFIYLTSTCGKKEKIYVNYDLIQNFEDADKYNLDTNEHINNGFQPKPDWLMNKPIRLAISKIFSMPLETINKDSRNLYNFPQMANAAFRIKFEIPKEETSYFKMIFCRDNDKNCCQIEINVKKQGDFQISSIREGIVIEKYSYPYDFQPDVSYTFNFLAFRNKVMLTDSKRVLFSTIVTPVVDTGGVLIDTDHFKSKGKYVLKFNTFDEDIANLFNHYIHEHSMWAKATAKLIYPDSDDQQPNLIHILYNRSSRRAIALPVGSKLTYEIKIPENSFLEYEYLTLRNLKTIRKGTTLKIEISGNDIKTITKYYPCHLNRNWNQDRIDLSNLSGKNVTLSISVEDKLKIEKKNDAVIFLANPVVRQKRKHDEKNILLISLDTLRPDHLGLYGYKRDTSPNIDRFASESIVFTNAFAHSPWTLPSHMALFTSRYPLESGHLLAHVWDTTRNVRISPEVTTLTEYLKENGYKTMAATGAGYISSLYDFDKGFEQYFELVLKNKADEIEKETETCLKYMDQSKNVKWFIFYHTFEIHWPYIREYFKADPADGLRADVIAKYDSGIHFSDQKVGLLLKKIEELGLDDDTLIIITSDHGESFYDHDTGKPEMDDAGRHGHNLYDVLLRVPLIIGGAREFQKGIKIDKQVRLVDLMPTILDYLHIDYSEDIRGESLTPLINAKEKKDRLSYAEAIYNSPNYEKKALRSNNYKLIANTEKDENQGRYEFYNINKDKQEKNNLVNNNTEKLDIFKQQLNKIIKSIAVNQHKLKKYIRRSQNLRRDLEDQLKALGYIGN